ncbi:histone-lysine N-methyltransferase, H3 lysine-9 specific SUVH6 isoform X2 [Eutrema salsugineum]|nr:histone-lysine N-methyltransferase, H3 lysine-9 specific SUVH6 isoform X2 [Eutrema salsugineum]
MSRLKFKRRNVYAVRDFPPGCGTHAMRLRPRTEAKPCQNGNVADDGYARSSSEAKAESLAKEEENLGQRDDDQLKPIDEQLRSSEAKAESSAKEEENLGQRDGDQLKPFDEQLRSCEAKAESSAKEEENLGQRDDDQLKPFGEQPCNDMVVAPEPEQEPMKEESDALMLALEDVKLPENTSDVPMVEPVEVQPLTICLPNSNGENAALVPVAGEQNIDRTGSMKKRLVVEKSGSGSSKRKAKKGIAFHEPLKLTKTTSREYGEGSRLKKNGEKRSSFPRERETPDPEEPVRRPKTLHVDIFPSRPTGSSSGDSMRNKVKETLRLFYGACRKLLQEEEAKPTKRKNFRVDFEASKILKSKGKFLNTGNQIMGTVPGVEVGDEFQYRMELNILGIHRPSQGGIDYMKVDGEIYATSIVASGGYDDELDNSDVLTYTGQGGNVIIKSKRGVDEKQPEDQKLVTGNLALANSINKKNPVRVIRGNKKAVLESSGSAKGGNYVYDGLYVVEEFWQETGSHGKLVFKFKLRRMPGQPELSWKVVKNTKRSEHREGLCRLDISEGHERLPICAVNEIDDEKPPPFIYTTKIIYPDWCRPIPPKACGCTTRCTETRNCACVAKNGGEIPYNYDGALVSFKNLVYECGPHCKCPPSCYLRVTQRGIKFKLEIFKTESRGWGVRSLSSIPSGSFICEYVGELLEDKEAERRIGNDEYLFDIGKKHDNTLAEGMSKLMPETQAMKEDEDDDDDDDDKTSGFTIDAAKKGNVGRFLNHSCSPNLFAQDVMYDHEDTRFHHVMFFAMDNIPPLRELTYHYNYKIDEVRDLNGNIKKKICYCGSSDCTGRLY